MRSDIVVILDVVFTKAEVISHGSVHNKVRLVRYCFNSNQPFHGFYVYLAC